jgi:hypothetical protein
MNTRTLALVAIIAVAAVAVVGAGYAYYWGQATVDNNTADVEYIAVSTDMTALEGVTVDFNTTSTGTIALPSYTLDVSGSKFVEIDGKKVTPITKEAGTAEELAASPIALAVGQKMLLKADKSIAADGYDFQVTIDRVTLGSNAQLYFMVAANAEPASVEGLKLNQFYPTGTEGEYVAIIPGQAIQTADGTTGGYMSAEFYGFIFLGETDADNAAGIQVTDVATAKVAFGDRSAEPATKSTIEFQALIDDVAAISDLTAAGTITITSETDGFGITKCVSTNTAVATVTDAGVVTKVADGEAKIIVQITKDYDVFYRIVGVTFS